MTMGAVKEALFPYFEQLEAEFMEREGRDPSHEEAAKLWEEAGKKWNEAMEGKAEALRDRDPQ
jgi:methionine salvage enolase-phosphatase E1